MCSLSTLLAPVSIISLMRDFLTLNGERQVNKVLSILVLTFLSNGASAGDLMKRFDLDSNDLVTMEELEQAGCTVKNSMFKAAGRNKDGTLSKKELRKSRDYLVTRKRCPKTDV